MPATDEKTDLIADLLGGSLGEDALSTVQEMDSIGGEAQGGEAQGGGLTEDVVIQASKDFLLQAIEVLKKELGDDQVNSPSVSPSPFLKSLLGYESKGKGKKKKQKQNMQGRPCIAGYTRERDGCIPTEIGGAGQQAPQAPGRQGYSESRPEVSEKPTAEEYNPDPHKPNPKTGIPDHARVGVPAMSVPPPPGIGRLPNLNEKQREVEARFAEAYVSDPDKMARKYLKALRKRKVGEYPNVFATDDVKALNGDWNPSNIGMGEKLDKKTKKAMAKYNAAIHQTANAVAKRAFLIYLDEVVADLPEEQRSVLVTNGGCAAGKGSSVRRAGDPEEAHHGLLPVAEQVGAIWDAAGEQNATENAWVYEECRKRGIKPIFAYVWADPETTWDHPDRGVIRRAIKKGRMVDARLFADSYALGAKNMKAFVDTNPEGAEFIFLDNRDKTDPQLLDSFPEETLAWDAEDIYHDAVQGLLRRKDDLDPALVEGGLIGSKIWGPPKEREYKDFEEEEFDA